MGTTLTILVGQAVVTSKCASTMPLGDYTNRILTCIEPQDIQRSAAYGIVINFTNKNGVFTSDTTCIEGDETA